MCDPFKLNIIPDIDDEIIDTTPRKLDDVIPITRDNTLIYISGTPSADEVKEFFDVHPWLSTNFCVTASTPLDHVISYFTELHPIQDLTTHLESGSAFPIVQGGLSDIYRATFTDQTQVAVKCLRRSTHGDSKDIKRAARELSAWSCLKHENILEFKGLARWRGCMGMVSPWMEMGNVVSVVKNCKDVDRADLMKQLAGAVAYLHGIGVVHGDLKADNVLVSRDYKIKLTDFGLAIMRETTLQLSETDPGGGTMRWMAPELLTDGGIRSKEADVYALGMTFYEIITTEVPFAELQSYHSIINAVARDKRLPTRPMKLLDGSPNSILLWSVIHRCWAYEPERRAGADEVAVLLGFCGVWVE